MNTTLDTTTGAEYVTTSKEKCSYDCKMDTECNYWMYDTARLKCSRKTANTTTWTSPGMMVYIGPKKCLGQVDEHPVSTIKEIDGEWSPWSTLNTPCFNMKSGKLAPCGGGLMKRHRSCSHPVPRFGGKICPGYDFDYAPCNTHACQRE